MVGIGLEGKAGQRASTDGQQERAAGQGSPSGSYSALQGGECGLVGMGLEGVTLQSSQCTLQSVCEVVPKPPQSVRLVSISMRAQVSPLCSPRTRSKAPARWASGTRGPRGRRRCCSAPRAAPAWWLWCVCVCGGGVTTELLGGWGYGGGQRLLGATWLWQHCEPFGRPATPQGSHRPPLQQQRDEQRHIVAPARAGAAAHAPVHGHQLGQREQRGGLQRRRRVQEGAAEAEGGQQLRVRRQEAPRAEDLGRRGDGWMVEAVGRSQADPA